MKILLGVVFTICTVIGCTVLPSRTTLSLSGSPEVKTVRQSSNDAIYDSLKSENLNLPMFSSITESIDQVSKILYLSVPPDFEAAKTIIQNKKPGVLRVILMDVDRTGPR